MQPAILLCLDFGPLLFWFSIAVLSYLSKYYNFFKTYITYFSEYYRLPGAMCAIELFLAMSQTKPFYSRQINKIAATSFGIYLIHDNFFFSLFIWKTVFNNSAYAGTPLYFAHFFRFCGDYFC
jgi:surface polysaccharide O-acyltransferase-like enzyme